MQSDSHSRDGSFFIGRPTVLDEEENMHLGQTTTYGLAGGVVLICSSVASFVGNSFSPSVPQSPEKLAPAGVAQTRDTADDSDQPGSPALKTLRLKIKELEQGLDFLDTIPTYALTLTKQEVVNGDLLDPHVMLLKYRRQPFSVYLRWLAGDEGREVLYVEGTHNNRLLGHDGGWRARIPAFYVSPHSSLAMRDSRYPVTAAGFQGLIEIMLEIHKNDLTKDNVASCELDSSAQFDGRPCDAFTTIYKARETSPTYRKSTTWFDREWHVPLKSIHYEWPKANESLSDSELDPATLIESYEFTEVDFHPGLQDIDFTRDHPEYHFR